jgi:hypothetical protein
MLRKASIVLLMSSASLRAQAPSDPVLNGIVTQVSSPTDFDVDGVRVVLHADTSFRRVLGAEHYSMVKPEPYLGQEASVWGTFNRKQLAVESTDVEFSDPKPATVSGSAIVDLVLADTAASRKVRADGRILELSSLPGNVTSGLPDGLQTNVWIDYHGVRQADGTILLDRAFLAPNALAKSQVKLDQKIEYDPAAVPDDSRQSATSKFFRGMDPKQLPPYRDAMLQGRVDRIGLELIPAYQRQLPESDPTRINFRFQVVDEPKWRDAHTLPNGIILVPYQIVQRLQDDSELAAVLADNIGTALEKQTFREIPNAHKLTAASLAGDAAGAIVPGVGLVTGATTIGIARHLITLDEQQSGREALALMHDAGYDLTKAPEAWWILATKEGEDPHRKPPPPRAVNQYQELATTWRTAPPASRISDKR